MAIKIKAFYPHYFYNSGIPGAAYNLIKGMQGLTHQISISGTASDASFKDGFYRNTIPRWAKAMLYKALPYATILKISEALYCKNLEAGDIAYLWPGVSLKTYQKLKARGCKLIYEGVNTHEALSKAILDKAYTQLGLTIMHGVTSEKVIDESAKLALVDYIFSCSEIMTQSMLDNGVPASKILATSYGLSSLAILDRDYAASQTDAKQATFIFVGSISVRKGVHLLLDYWVKAKLNAKLQLVGSIEEAIKPLIESYVGKHNIEHIPFTNDLSGVYKNADVFVLPSLEEGSPLVTYMAFGAGLPLLVSPMGGGGVVADGVEGVVVDPYDAELWVSSLQKLATDSSLRTKLAAESRSRAPYYLWDAVAKRRLQALLAAIESQAKV